MSSVVISDVRNFNRPEAQNKEAALVGCVSLVVPGIILLLTGSIMLAVAKKWGYDGDVIHNMDLYHKGFIITLVGCGMLGVGGCVVGAAGNH
jgi:hypothetical protein